jgi:sec-independent protein translocase protein TatC
MAVTQIQPFKEHVAELRQRIMVAVTVAFIGVSIGYAFHDLLIKWLSTPLHQRLYYTSPSGGLQFTMQICIFAGVILALPVAVYELVCFVQPAVKPRGRAYLIRRSKTIEFIAASYLLALFGAAFAYFLVLPTALHFFASFNSSEVQSFITADKYFSFVVNCIGVFAAIFQLPLILLFINRIRPISTSKMRKYRKAVIIGSFLVALVLPFAYDPLTQFLMALPIIVLYELSIILIALANRHQLPAFPPIAKNIDAELVPIFSSSSIVYDEPADFAQNIRQE